MTKKITISEHRNLVDMAIEQYGHAESIVQLCLDNGLGVDATLVPGNTLLIDGAKPYKTTGPISAPVQAALKRALTVVEHQNIIDACLQEYGSVEQLVKLCSDNQLNVGGTMIVGSTLVVGENTDHRQELYIIDKCVWRLPRSGVWNHCGGCRN